MVAATVPTHLFSSPRHDPEQQSYQLSSLFFPVPRFHIVIFSLPHIIPWDLPRMLFLWIFLLHGVSGVEIWLVFSQVGESRKDTWMDCGWREGWQDGRAFMSWVCQWGWLGRSPVSLLWQISVYLGSGMVGIVAMCTGADLHQWKAIPCCSSPSSSSTLASSTLHVLIAQKYQVWSVHLLCVLQQLQGQHCQVLSVCLHHQGLWHCPRYHGHWTPFTTAVWFYIFFI